MEQHYWYFSSYAIVYLFSPMINKGLLSLSKSRLKQVIFLLLLIACIGGNINMKNFGLLGGYSPLWLAILWVIGGYIRLYGVGGRKYLHLGMYLLFVILNLALSNVISILKYYLTGNPQKFNLSLVIRYNNPLVVIASIALVVFILKIRINNKGVQKVLLFASPLSFGAYLLQTNIFVYQTLNYPWLLKQNIIVMFFDFIISLTMVCRGGYNWLYYKNYFFKNRDWLITKINCHQIWRVTPRRPVIMLRCLILQSALFN